MHSGTGALERGRPFSFVLILVERWAALRQGVASRPDRGGVFMKRSEFDILREIFDGRVDTVESFEQKPAVAILARSLGCQGEDSVETSEGAEPIALA